MDVGKVKSRGKVGSNCTIHHPHESRTMCVSFNKYSLTKVCCHRPGHMEQTHCSTSNMTQKSLFAFCFFFTQSTYELMKFKDDTKLAQRGNFYNWFHSRSNHTFNVIILKKEMLFV